MDNKIKALVIGISGGIDSTVCAAICSKVCNILSIPLIGRSLCINNKPEEIASSLLASSFCTNFKALNIKKSFEFLKEAFTEDNDSLIASGNIQARLRMIYLYNLAGLNNGIVIDTDNLTEHYLGFFTLHGDVGDYKPIGNLWKTEVYELAKVLLEYYEENSTEYKALKEAINITPTDGLGISNSDLEQIGAKTYEEVDAILQREILHGKYTSDKLKSLIIDSSVKEKVLNRYRNSEFKRRSVPIANSYKEIIKYKDAPLNTNFISANFNSAINSYGERFNVGDVVIDDNKDSATIQGFTLDVNSQEVKAFTSKGWKHIDFIYKNLK